MCPESNRNGLAGLPRRVAPRGFSIVSAIFLLIVLAALGAMMVTFSTVQHTTSAQDLLGARAYHAARAGAEWGIYQVLINPGAGYELNCQDPAGTTQTLPALGGTLATFTVTVACSSSAYVEGATALRVYQLTSNASSGVGTAYYVQRQVQVTVPR